MEMRTVYPPGNELVYTDVRVQNCQNNAIMGPGFYGRTARPCACVILHMNPPESNFHMWCVYFGVCVRVDGVP